MSNKNEEIINSIFFRRKHKIIINNSKDINQFFKLNLEKAIENDEYITSSKHYISVKSCNLLYCALTVDNESNIEFENGNLLNNTALDDTDLTKKLKELVENETKIIREKLNLALSINENILPLGYCMDVDLIKNVALYDEKQMNDFNIFLPIQINKKYEPVYPNFPEQHINSEFFYFYYCKWLYSLENAPTDSLINSPTDDNSKKNLKRKRNLKEAELSESHAMKRRKNLNSNIPITYKHMLENDKIIKSHPLYKFLFTNFFHDNINFTVISMGNINEYYQMMSDIMSSSTPFSSSDINDLENFIRYDECHLEYIPETIPLKENIAQISRLLFKYHENMSQTNLILPKYEKPEVDDVLQLALTINNIDMPLHSSPNFEHIDFHKIELILELLNRCDDRFNSFVKKYTTWCALFNKLDCTGFRNIYPELYNEKESMRKYKEFNSIFFNRLHKIIMYNKETDMLNKYFYANLEKALKENEYINNSKKYNLAVKQCNFINCILILNNTTEIEFENAKCIRGSNAITDDTFMEKLKFIIKEKTDDVKEKLKYPLILTENLFKFGYNLSPELMQILAFYDKYEIIEMGEFLTSELKRNYKSLHYVKFDINLINFDEKIESNQQYNEKDDDELSDLYFSDSSSEPLYDGYESSDQ